MKMTNLASLSLHNKDFDRHNFIQTALRNLIIDIGNTRTKAAVFEDENRVLEQSFEGHEGLAEFVRNQDHDHCLISSVTLSEAALQEMLGISFLYLTKDIPLPISNLYASPATLGVDRKAAAVGARVIVPRGPVLAIDLGSCITYDYVNEADQYLGGAISPGLRMRFRAMHEQTARLPLAGLENIGGLKFMADNTHEGLQSGVYYGMLYEMEGFIRAYQRQHQDLKVIICGGDSKFFESLTKDYIFVIPNLVLHGLNRILTYNVNKK